MSGVGPLDDEFHRRDDAAKTSSDSFHASAGARLVSSTRNDNPFTSGEEEVRIVGAR